MYFSNSLKVDIDPGQERRSIFSTAVLVRVIC
jgi:hypothetical protein